MRVIFTINNVFMRFYLKQILIVFIVVFVAKLGFGQENEEKKQIIRRNGFYNTYDTTMLECGIRSNEHYTTKDIVAFLDDNKIFYNAKIGTHGMPDFNSPFIKFHASKLVGDYNIIRDSIYAKIPTQFAGNGERVIYRTAYYKGFIKNQDTILGWKMCPPYPKVNMRLNKYLKTDTSSKLLYFIKYEKVVDLRKHIDNVSE